MGTLAVGDSYEQIVRVTVPGDLPPGQYFITPWSDSYDVEPEDTLAVNINPDDPNEIDNNNYKGRAIDILGYAPVRPNLVVETVSGGAQVTAGSEPITVNWTVRNDSYTATEATHWVDRIYLSDKPELGIRPGSKAVTVIPSAPCPSRRSSS